jgi:hypothetical protein
MKWGDYLMVAVGVLYVVNPNVFRRYKWSHRSAMQRHLTPETYNWVMRAMGAALILWGFWPILHLSVRH